MPLEDRIQQSVETALADLRARIEQDLRAMTQQLIAAASDERDQAVNAAREATRGEAAQDAQRLVAEAEARGVATLEQALTDARAREREATDAAQRAAREEAAQETRRLVAEAEARAASALEQAVSDARAKERETAAAEIRRGLEAETEQKLAAVRMEADQELTAALMQAEQRANAAIQEAVVAARAREREAEMADVSRLLESIRALDGATALSEVLDALGWAAGRETSRAAVLVLRNDRLLGWKLSGFGPRDSQPKQVDLSIDEGGVAGLSVESARVMTTRDASAPSDGPMFAELPVDRMGLAVPVIVGGRVVAVVYADGVTPDESAHVVPSSWPEVIEVLARHAARCLESLTVLKGSTIAPSPRLWVPPPGGKEATASPTPPPSETPVPAGEDTEREESSEESARRVARLLLAEIKMYHEPAVDEGRRSRNLLSRLGPEIERARRIYDDRVPASLRTRAELFQQELVETLAGGDPTVLGVQT